MENKSKFQWLKAIALTGVLMSARLAFATDSINSIPELNTQASSAIEVIQFIAKWGGVTAIIVSVLAIGMGRAKGETATVLCSLGIMIGGVAAAWGYYTTSFTHGFVF